MNIKDWLDQEQMKKDIAAMGKQVQGGDYYHVKDEIKKEGNAFQGFSAMMGGKLMGLDMMTSEDIKKAWPNKSKDFYTGAKVAQSYRSLEDIGISLGLAGLSAPYTRAQTFIEHFMNMKPISSKSINTDARKLLTHAKTTPPAKPTNDFYKYMQDVVGGAMGGKIKSIKHVPGNVIDFPIKREKRLQNMLEDVVKQLNKKHGFEKGNEDTIQEELRDRLSYEYTSKQPNFNYIQMLKSLQPSNTSPDHTTLEEYIKSSLKKEKPGEVTDFPLE